MLAAPLACGLAAAAAALAALWGLGRAGRAVPVKLPKVERGTELVKPDFGGHAITVRADGGYALGGSRLSRLEIKERLERLGGLPGAGEERVIIRADAGVRFEKVVDLLQVCRRAGLSSVRFEVVEESP